MTEKNIITVEKTHFRITFAALMSIITILSVFSWNAATTVAELTEKNNKLEESINSLQNQVDELKKELSDARTVRQDISIRLSVIESKLDDIRNDIQDLTKNSR